MSEKNKEVVQEQVKQNEKSSIIIVPIKSPITLDGTLLNEVKLDFSGMTGADVLKIDSDLRQEGHRLGFDNLFNQQVLLQIAARGSKILAQDLMRLHTADYLEVIFQTRNFFLEW
ncbi:hypothetical protein MHH70_12545 [Metasolibacillus sp. FSL H7-0170]|uniref:hypothetical protein n=1 Tax=Metasolibacillus sp. FSL H7-0170 TaxID=2921431 RepID=UPI003158F96F